MAQGVRARFPSLAADRVRKNPCLPPANDGLLSGAPISTQVSLTSFWVRISLLKHNRRRFHRLVNQWSPGVVRRVSNSSTNGLLVSLTMPLSPRMSLSQAMIPLLIYHFLFQAQ